MSYDSWKTTPPRDDAYCPWCYADDADAERVADDDGLVWMCQTCGMTYHYPLSYAEMAREAKVAGQLDRAGL